MSGERDARGNDGFVRLWRSMVLALALRVWLFGNQKTGNPVILVGDFGCEV